MNDYEKNYKRLKNLMEDFEEQNKTSIDFSDNKSELYLYFESYGLYEKFVELMRVNGYTSMGNDNKAQLIVMLK